MLSVFKQIFSQVRYVTIALITSAIVFTFAVWLPNFRLIGEVVFNSSASAVEKVGFLFSLFWSIQTNFTALSASYTIAIAILFGINIALLVYYIRSRKTSALGSGATLSVGGLVSGIFGIGCAACGTFILTSVLSLVGAAGVISFLPFNGGEFGILGVILIGYATYWTAKKIKEPLVCEV